MKFSHRHYFASGLLLDTVFTRKILPTLAWSNSWLILSAVKQGEPTTVHGSNLVQHLFFFFSIAVLIYGFPGGSDSLESTC